MKHPPGETDSWLTGLGLSETESLCQLPWRQQAHIMRLRAFHIPAFID